MKAHEKLQQEPFFLVSELPKKRIEVKESQVRYIPTRLELQPDGSYKATEWQARAYGSIHDISKKTGIPRRALMRLAKCGTLNLSRSALLPQQINAIYLWRDRAYADSNGIHVNRSTSTSTILHEMMHQVEQQPPQTLAKSAEFLFARARIINGKIESPQQLSHLTGKAYEPHEYAIQDEFESKGGTSYMGKLYIDKVLTYGRKSVTWNQEQYDTMSPAQRKRAIQSTELLSSGIERLIKNPILFYHRDPHYFNFIIRTLKNK